MPSPEEREHPRTIPGAHDDSVPEEDRTAAVRDAFAALRAAADDVRAAEGRPPATAADVVAITNSGTAEQHEGSVLFEHYARHDGEFTNPTDDEMRDRYGTDPRTWPNAAVPPSET